MSVRYSWIPFRAIQPAGRPKDLTSISVGIRLQGPRIEANYDGAGFYEGAPVLAVP